MPVEDAYARVRRVYACIEDKAIFIAILHTPSRRTFAQRGLCLADVKANDLSVASVAIRPLLCSALAFGAEGVTTALSTTSAIPIIKR